MYKLFEKYRILGEVDILFVIILYLISQSPFLFESLFLLVQILFIIFAYYSSYEAEQEFKKPSKIENENYSCNDKIDFNSFQKFLTLFRMNLEIWVYYFMIYYAYFIVKDWIIAQDEPFFKKTKPICIIIIKYHDFFRKRILYGFGLDLLIKHFRNKTPYAIYPCKTKEGFIEIITDNDVKNVWIFGHGDHGGVRYNSTDKILDYKELVDTLPSNLKKDSIYQMHCNHGNRPSLKYLLSEDRRFANDTKNTMFKIRSFVRKILIAEYPII